MTADDVRDALDLIERHRTLAISAAGLAMLLLSSLGWMARKRLKGKGDLFGRFCDTAAIVIAVALSAEGMWEVATERMGFGPEKAVLLFAFAELAMTRAARRARAKAERGKPPGPYGVMVWGIGLSAGVIASTNAPNTAEMLVRLLAPAVVAAQWWADLVETLREKRGDAEQRSSWIWTPRTIGIRLGLVRPGAQDLEKVDRERRINQITVTAHRLHHGWARLAGWRTARLRRLALQADGPMVGEAQRRVARVNQIVALTSPTATSGGQLDDHTRAALDEVRLSARDIATRGRADALRAFAPPSTWSAALDQDHALIGSTRTQQADQVWSNPVVQIRTRTADRAALVRRIEFCPTDSGGMLDALIDAVAEPAQDAVAEPVRESTQRRTGEPTAAQKSLRRSVSEPIRKSAQVDSGQLAEAYERLTIGLGHAPSGQELANETGVSKATANRWKRDRTQARS